MRFKLKDQQEVEVFYEPDSGKLYVKSEDLSSFDCFIASNEVDRFVKDIAEQLIGLESVDELEVRKLHVMVKGNGITEKIGLGEIRDTIETGIALDQQEEGGSHEG